MKDSTPTQIKDELNAVYGESAPSFTTVKFWATEFKRGHTSLRDDERSGRPKFAITYIAQVHQRVLYDRRIKGKEIAEAMNMFKKRFCHILNQDLGMRKMSEPLYAAFADVRPKTCSNKACPRSLAAIY